MRIGITGQEGFVGSHLTNYLELQEGVELVPYDISYFQNPDALTRFAGQCDAVVHLAGVNRHADPNELYQINLELTERLIAACDAAGHHPHVLFSSSTQEERDNLYGRSKRDSRLRFEEWAARTGATFNGLIIPNVFGPFGRPKYNSVTATFCHQVTHGIEPTVHDRSSPLEMIHTNELVSDIWDLLQRKESGTVRLAPRHFMTVGELVDKLLHYRATYMERDTFPDLSNPTDLVLFNTFRCYIPYDFYPRPYTKHTDPRGSFVEITRAQTPGQSSYSTTAPGITRGNHFHTRKAERFAVIRGKARIQLRRIGTNEVINYDIDGEKPAYVDMPIWHTHNLINTGDEELITLFWINEPYDPADPDTYYVDVE